MFIGVNMVEIEYEGTRNGFTRRTLIKEAQRVLDEHRDADPKVVESLGNIVHAMDREFNGISPYEYPTTGYENIESSIFTAIGTTISKRAEDVEKELESLLEKFYSLQSSDRELVEYKEKKFLITKKTSNEDKIAFLTEVYKENPDILDDAIKSICTKGNLHRWGPLVRRS